MASRLLFYKYIRCKEALNSQICPFAEVGLEQLCGQYDDNFGRAPSIFNQRNCIPAYETDGTRLPLTWLTFSVT